MIPKDWRELTIVPTELESKNRPRLEVPETAILPHLDNNDRRRCIGHVSRVSVGYEVLFFYRPESYDPALAAAKEFSSVSYHFWGLKINNGYLLYCRVGSTKPDHLKSLLMRLKRGPHKHVINPEPSSSL
ncbi:MAG: hypothetical protein ACRERU_03535 [Methylococcales bacterium]